MRGTFLLFHRWGGLLIAGFLFVAGVTGSIIAFHHELDEWLNPNFFTAKGTGAALSPSRLVTAIEAAEPRARVSFLVLPEDAGKVAVMFVQGRRDAATGKRHDLGYNQLFVDPATGAVLGRRFFGACCFQAERVIPFLYRLHYTLHLHRPWGDWLMGGIALIWLIDCFVAAYLTMPRAQPFRRNWGVAWRIKKGAGAYRKTFDIHRAGGLWLWGLLLVVAFSGAYLNLTDEVFRPAVSVFSPLKPTPREAGMARLTANPEPARVSYDQAVDLAMAAARGRGWSVTPATVSHLPRFQTFSVGLRPDHGLNLGPARVYLDDRTGEVLRADYPGDGSAGDAFLAWQFPLHSGEIAGLPGRILICLSGILVAVLSVTGVAIWWKKRRARRVRVARAVAS